MNRNFYSLETLDQYAKLLTDRQVNKLYESKVNKPYRKLILEENNVESKCRCFVPMSAIDKTGIDVFDFMNLIQFGNKEDDTEKIPDIDFNTKNFQGIWIGCKFGYSFEIVLKRLMKYGIKPEDVEQYVYPQKFVAKLYPEGDEITIL